MLCDGRLVCGCADPYAKRVVGDARVSSIRDVWTGDTMARLRADMNGGASPFCGDCPLKRPLRDEQPVPQRGLDVAPHPSRMFIESTAACNLSCFQSCCAPETGIAKTREAGMLDFDLFTRVVDEVGASLVRIDFFNYGESFLHKRAVEMCEYIKTKFPQVYVYTSTNGLALNDVSARRLARSGIDEVTFSLDGSSQDAYARYRQRGQFDVALANLRTLVAEKHKAGLDVPFVNWRYILFKWNDTDEEMERARKMAEEIGVDRLAWEITDHPEEAFSRRFAPGTPDYERIHHEVWDTSHLGNAIRGATPLARIEVPTRWMGLALVGRRGRTMKIRTRVHNLSTRPFPKAASYGRRLVRLGAQLCDQTGTLIERDYARAWLPHDLPGGQHVDITIEVPAPPTRGRYQLKFDLVFEGVDWFEACGSPTPFMPLRVV
jgi:MoaA/NifB/PqqE/SkfB family radical SAM enzyme